LSRVHMVLAARRHDGPTGPSIPGYSRRERWTHAMNVLIHTKTMITGHGGVIARRTCNRALFHVPL